MATKPKRKHKSSYVSQPMSSLGGSKTVTKDETLEEPKSKPDKKATTNVLKLMEKSIDQTRRVPSRQRPVSKGLSPPKEPPTKSDDPDRYNKSDDPELGVFDKTQWERSRWGADYSQCDRTRTRTVALSTTSPAPVVVVAAATVPGEDRQIELVKGEHLKNKPMFQLILLAIEGVFCAVTMSVWSAAAQNPMLPFLLALINGLVVFSLICIVFATEFFRFQVKKIEKDEEIGGKTKHTTKFQIPYRWRFSLLACHVGRALLICSCITIMALDNDFDGGSIAVLALQPFHLIIITLQIFFALRPKRKE